MTTLTQQLIKERDRLREENAQLKQQLQDALTKIEELTDPVLKKILEDK